MENRTLILPGIDVEVRCSLRGDQHWVELTTPIEVVRSLRIVITGTWAYSAKSLQKALDLLERGILFIFLHKASYVSHDCCVQTEIIPNNEQRALYLTDVLEMFLSTDQDQQLTLPPLSGSQTIEDVIGEVKSAVDRRSGRLGRRRMSVTTTFDPISGCYTVYFRRFGL